MHAGCDYPGRVAMISMHTSPLATPGLGDAGGLNVYVAELARRLGERAEGGCLYPAGHPRWARHC